MVEVSSTVVSRLFLPAFPVHNDGLDQTVIHAVGASCFFFYMAETAHWIHMHGFSTLASTDSTLLNTATNCSRDSLKVFTTETIFPRLNMAAVQWEFRVWFSYLWYKMPSEDNELHLTDAKLRHWEFQKGLSSKYWLGSPFLNFVYRSKICVFLDISHYSLHLFMWWTNLNTQ